MKIKRFSLLAALLLYVFCLSFAKSIDFSQDLGRHLKLGEIIFNTGSVPRTNLFSYTNTGFPFINHHWLSEFIFYILVSLFGLGSLFALRFILLSVSLLASWKSAASRTYNSVAVLLILIYSPLLYERIDIRPEYFGYAFFALLLYILFFQNNRRLFYFIPLIMVLWVNMHISFVFGLFLLVIAGIRDLRKKSAIWMYVISCAALFLNPHGLYGIMEPFTIFRNYGYSIVENQNLFFLISLGAKPLLRYYLFLSPLVLIAITTLLSKKKYSLSLLLTVFFLLGFWQIRHISFFVFIAIPATSLSLKYLADDLRSINAVSQLKRVSYYFVAFSLTIILCLGISSNLYSRNYDNMREFGYGFYENQKQATDFILQHHLAGNLFNNFDIGGYAIYRLYPRYRVFVDNRPEAYPAEFFQKTYIPLQEDDGMRKQVFKRYGIHTVLFAHSDITPWGISFMRNILKDSGWRMLFANSTVFVMSDVSNLPDIRANPANMQSLIDVTENPEELLSYAQFFTSIGAYEEAQNALAKAQKINPFSCTLKKIRYEQQNSSSYFFSGNIEMVPWWCY